ncbi:hypothetical protein OGAPHI_002138 [Ogataea philodendri]|uniref:Xaa-Pro dipeptidyl-peptidase C-terminal domain-containing protein n=1 Tax=Ogataea philodendri TaxID=1378263 RepID=A0A9P8PBU1_9ASCO|nr:uncharacterized protein OGAPHI_002138 [Ogataea philodendri]KAH3668384.1 hypothetical protein OGAPHI_002138 [Ogataea philodendri]
MAFNVKSSKREQITVLEPESLPFKYLYLRNIDIPVRDGAILKGHLWIPKDAWEGDLKVGTLVEYIPYRTDVTIQRDSIRHPYYAGNGLASLRIDMRGSASSDGVLTDEYLKLEQDDALDAFDYIVKQKWSNGKIGMFGKSWGGFNGLQVAARRHPALKAVISLMSTDDRYSDDVHYRGGCVFASNMLWWGSTMAAYAPRPQDPRVVGDSWKENWKQRIEVAPMVKHWLEHQTRDEYWKHGSICEDYNQVDIPVMLIGGWKDGYTTPVFRMVDKLPHPQSCGIVGPWVHEYPEMATPGPKIGYQQLSLKWFKKWLHDEGEIELPRMTAYMQDPVGIEDSYDYRNGHWVSTNDVKFKKGMELSLGANNELVVAAPAEINYSFSGVESHGLFRGTWCPFGYPGDFPSDQKSEDARCLCFDTEELTESLELLGEPKLTVTLSSDKKLANLSARLVDLYPGKENVLLSWGQLNLTHHKSHEHPEYLQVGEKYTIELNLDVVGVKIEKGHKLRLALSSVDWPQAWPSPETPTLTLTGGKLWLPQVDEAAVVQSPDFGTPSIVRKIKTQVDKPDSRTKTITYDCTTYEWIIKDIADDGEVTLPEFNELSGIYNGACNVNTWKIKENDPLSAYNECQYDYWMGRKEDNWNVRMDTRATMTSDKDNFYLHNKIVAYDNDEIFVEKEWTDTIKRVYN